MFSSRDAFENDFCPVRDELLGEMYRANENGLPQLVESVSSDVRAMLALFCYRRSHLHSLALSIAASCSERELIQFGGRVGSTLYALSREPAARAAPSSSYGNRKPITLSTKPLSHLLADRGRTRRRFCRSRDGLTSPSSVVPRNESNVCNAHQRMVGHGQMRFARYELNTRQPVPPPRHLAFGIAGHAGPAHFRPHRIDRA